jgi:spermidine/putrescine transport system permease protein
VSAPSSTGGKIARFALNAYAALALLYLFVPIIWIVVFSFNRPKGTYNTVWQEFTLENWADPFADEALTNAFIESLKPSPATSSGAAAASTSSWFCR